PEPRHESQRPRRPAGVGEDLPRLRRERVAEEPHAAAVATRVRSFLKGPSTTCLVAHRSRAPPTRGEAMQRSRLGALVMAASAAIALGGLSATAVAQAEKAVM